MPDIAKYILDNDDGFIFSSITASFNTTVNFRPSLRTPTWAPSNWSGRSIEFIINDGQHHCALSRHALKENPVLGKEKISVLLFPMENFERLQQMFTDLNHFGHKTSKSLDILYDHRDNLSALTMDVSEQVVVFKAMVDKEKITIPIRSPKLFTLATLYDANEELLGDKIESRGTKESPQKVAVGSRVFNTFGASHPRLEEGQGRRSQSAGTATGEIDRLR